MGELSPRKQPHVISSVGFTRTAALRIRRVYSWWCQTGSHHHRALQTSLVLWVRLSRDECTGRPTDEKELDPGAFHDFCVATGEF